MIGCTEEPAPIAVASVTLDSTSMTLEEGESQKLTATVSPSNAENKVVIWTSSNSSVASVKDGLVTAIKFGNATITVKSDDGGKTSTCEVTVNAKVYPVESVSLDKTSCEMTEGDEVTLTAIVKPDNATNKNVTWSSSNTSVATVSNGKVTALEGGRTTIIVSSADGGKTATCEMTVKANYVDEYGINHGPGIVIGDVVWSPVNCGYHKEDFKYGKLYQWGRRYGQGYEGDLYDINGNNAGTYKDSSVPTIEKGQVSAFIGNLQSNENIFYKSSIIFADWASDSNDNFWNYGSESNPVKAEYDPCPDGWRVPTYTELNELSANKSSWATNSDGQIGYWFSGASSHTEDVPHVFFPAAGSRLDVLGIGGWRGTDGIYWSSTPNNDLAFYLVFGDCYANMNSWGRSNGCSVRCVQE